MPSSVYSEINFHITWHTKSSLPIITAGVDDGCGICGKTQTKSVTIK